MNSSKSTSSAKSTKSIRSQQKKDKSKKQKLYKSEDYSEKDLIDLRKPFRFRYFYKKSSTDPTQIVNYRLIQYINEENNESEVQEPKPSKILTKASRKNQPRIERILEQRKKVQHNQKGKGSETRRVQMSETRRMQASEKRRVQKVQKGVNQRDEKKMNVVRKLKLSKSCEEKELMNELSMQKSSEEEQSQVQNSQKKRKEPRNETQDKHMETKGNNGVQKGNYGVEKGNNGVYQRNYGVQNGKNDKRIEQQQVEFHKNIAQQNGDEMLGIKQSYLDTRQMIQSKQISNMSESKSGTDNNLGEQHQDRPVMENLINNFCEERHSWFDNYPKGDVSGRVDREENEDQGERSEGQISVDEDIEIKFVQNSIVVVISDSQESNSVSLQEVIHNNKELEFIQIVKSLSSKTNTSTEAYYLKKINAFQQYFNHSQFSSSSSQQTFSHKNQKILHQTTFPNQSPQQTPSQQPEDQIQLQLTQINHQFHITQNPQSHINKNPLVQKQTSRPNSINLNLVQPSKKPSFKPQTTTQNPQQILSFKQLQPKSNKIKFNLKSFDKQKSQDQNEELLNLFDYFKEFQLQEKKKNSQLIQNIDFIQEQQINQNSQTKNYPNQINSFKPPLRFDPELNLDPDLQS